MYVEGHLTDKITLKNTARLFSVSESTIVKLFRRSLNVSFSQYVTQRRLISAKHI